MLKKILVGAGMAYLGRRLIGGRGKSGYAIRDTGRRNWGLGRSW